MSLFKPFRALGYITDNVPFAVQRRGKETYVVVSVGRTWQVYNTAKLTLVLVGPQLRHDVTALACKGDLTFAATGSTIQECKRAHHVAEYAGHSGRVLQLLVLGDSLLSLGKDRQLLVWNIGEHSAPQVRIQLEEGFNATCMAHPDTYLNKVVLGASDGRLQLWNFATGTLLYTFSGWGSGVRCIAPSPALDVVGIGLVDGRAVLHNLRCDKTVVAFNNASGVGAGDALLGGAPGAAAAGGACTCIAFRTGAGTPLMAAGGGAGIITVWNLEHKRLQTILRDAHDAPLLALHFFAGEPLLMSAGADNAIKQWVFDAADGSGRLLRFRSGHSAPPTHVKHYGQGLRLLSAGRDRAFRVFSTIQDQQSRELAQHKSASKAKRLRLKEEVVKLAPIVALDACEVRERDWCNVITAHEGDPRAYTWRLQHFTLGEYALAPPPEALGNAAAAPVTAVAISCCGNFGVVGSAGGRVDRYNLQSGQHRGSYARRDAAGQAVLPAHAGAVVGVAVDSYNRLLVSAGWDGCLCTWDFKKQTPVASIDVGSPLTHMAMHSSSALAAVATSQHAVRMYDVEAGRLVRRFSGHKDRITDLHISADCRWLLSASMDGTVRAWDIPAAQCLQVMRLGAPVTSLSLTPSKDSLATTHVHKRGIFLWSNQLMFGDGASLALYSDKPVDVGLPTITSGQQRKGEEEEGEQEPQANGGTPMDASSDDADDDSSYGASSSDSEDEEAPATSPAAAAAAAAAGPLPHQLTDSVTGAPQPLTPSLATLSLLPRSQWENLLHLDLIKARNRPIAPPKKPEAAPFFLPTVAGLEGRPVFDASAANQQGQQRQQGQQQSGRKQPREEGAEGSGDAGGDDGWGVDSDDEERAAAGAAASTADRGAVVSRVMRSKGVAHANTFVRLLRAGSDAGDYSSFVAHLRGLSPAALDRQLRGLVLLPGASEEEVSDVAALLECLELEGASNRNFEFCAALLQAVLRLHADGIMAHPRLAEAAGRLRRQLGTSWRRVDYLLHSVRCMVDFYSGNQL